MRRHLLTLFISLLMALTAFAQPGRGGMPGGITVRRNSEAFTQQKGFIHGNVLFSPEEPGQPESPGVGAVVLVISAKQDTLFTTVGGHGSFFIMNVPVGKTYIKFSMMGYEEIARVVDIVPGENKLLANLKPKTEEIAEAVIKESVSPVSVVNDTIIFHASAVKVNKGEMAIDILEQMPGVEVTDSGVTVLNEEVKNVYVDGALLFGAAPMRALNNLAAEEVVDIRSYQEYANKDPYHKISKTEQKERVLDVRTKHKPKSVIGGDTIAGAGFDTDSTYHKFRYLLGGDVNRFSESLQVMLGYNINNINSPLNRRRGGSFRRADGGGSADLRDFQVNAIVNRRWMSPTARNFALGSANFNYSYRDKYDVNESITQQLYFPNEKYDYREVNRTSYSNTNSKQHDFSVGGNKSLKDGDVRLKLNYSLGDNTSKSLSSNYNHQDNLSPQGTSSSTSKQSHSQSYGASLNFDKGFDNKVRISMSASFNGSANDSGTAKIDTTTSTITYKVIDIDGTGTSRNYTLHPQVSFLFGENTTLVAAYTYSNTYRVSEQLALDITDPSFSVTDTVNTHRYTTDNNSHSATLGLSRHFDAIRSVLDISLLYRSTGLNKHESFPVDDPYSHRFNAFQPTVHFYNNTMIDKWDFQYSASSNNPSLEQIRPRINNSNLYSVSSGNPDLRQSMTHQASFGYSTVLGAEARESLGSVDPDAMQSGNRFMARGGAARYFEREMRQMTTFAVNASFKVTTDPIVSRRIYYAKETYLPEYDYTMPAQSTFSSYENVGNSYSAQMSVQFGVPVFDNRWMLSTGAAMSWDDTPSYVDYTLTRTSNMHPNMNVGMRSNFSRNFRLNVSANASYTYSNNSLKDATSYFVERIRIGMDINNILKHGYLDATYNKSFTQGLEYGKLDDHILNLSAGWKWGPRNNYDLAVSVNDLFNSRTGFSTSMTSDYVTNSWRHNFGRYVLFTFAYRFNNMRGQNGERIGGRPRN